MGDGNQVEEGEILGTRAGTSGEPYNTCEGHFWWSGGMQAQPQGAEQLAEGTEVRDKVRRRERGL